MTLKLEGDLDILKMYLHTENEAASIQNLEIELEKIQNVLRTNVKVKMSKPPNYYHNRHSDQAPHSSSFWPAVFQLHATAFVLPWPLTHDLETEPWPNNNNNNVSLIQLQTERCKVTISATQDSTYTRISATQGSTYIQFSKVM